MGFRDGDRVRIKNPASEYTGCRGTIADGEHAAPAGVTALGHQVAIDGENGRTRPFLISDLEPLAAARVRRPAANSAGRDDAHSSASADGASGRTPGRE